MPHQVRVVTVDGWLAKPFCAKPTLLFFLHGFWLQTEIMDQFIGGGAQVMLAAVYGTDVVWDSSDLTSPSFCLQIEFRVLHLGYTAPKPTPKVICVLPLFPPMAPRILTRS